MNHLGTDVGGAHPLLDMACALGLPAGEAVVMGSTALHVRGLLDRPIGDIDVIAVGGTWARLAGHIAPVPARSGVGHAIRLVVEVFDAWPGIADISGLIARAEHLHGLPVAALADVLADKARMGRAKDLHDLAHAAR